MQFSSMPLRLLGRSNIQVSALGFGAGVIGDTSMSEGDVEALLQRALDVGITLFDTAPSYGESEARLGRHLKAYRDYVVLSTKVGYGVDGYQDWTADCIHAGVDRALERLQTDRIDIVHLHSCPLHVLQNNGVAEALQREVEQGKVRAAGYSGEGDALSWSIHSDLFDVLQCSVNVCDQHALQAYLPEARRRGLGVIAKRPMANAVWRFEASPEREDLRIYWSRLRDMDNLQESLSPEHLDLSTLALRFAAFAPNVDTCLVGTRRLEHLEQNIEHVYQGPLTLSTVDAIRHAFWSKQDRWMGVI